jgi:starvation-inducible DNA-binding protein
MGQSTLNVVPEVDQPDTGFERKMQLSASMAACLANTYFLMFKTQACHWNAAGPSFFSVHQLTEEQYNDLFKAVDDLAERIRALGHLAPSSIAEMAAHNRFEEFGHNVSTHDMLSQLANDHETLAREFRSSIERADACGDVVSADLLTERLHFHEKAIWMLRAMMAS